MIEPARIYEREDHVDSQLRLIGITRDVLRTATIFGEAEGNACTAFDPRILKGVWRWGRTVGSLRLQQTDVGWSSADVHGMPIALSPDHLIAMTVETGDEHTGRPKSRRAYTKHGKGPALRDWVSIPDEPQISFEDPDPKMPAAARPELWILLIDRTETDIWSELSCPTSVTPDKRICFGGQRIIMPPIPIDQIMRNEHHEDHDDEQKFDVDVTRRS